MKAMTATEIRAKYLKFFADRGHAIIPRAQLVPQDDPTTLFTGSGMQPLLPYLLGQEHPEGTKLVDSQPCLRAQDIDEVGDNSHTTFFEMLGNWSLGEYFKAEQLPYIFEFLVDVVGLDPQRLYATCFIGDPANDIPKDSESATIWKRLFEAKHVPAKEVEIGSATEGSVKGMQGGRIFSMMMLARTGGVGLARLVTCRRESRVGQTRRCSMSLSRNMIRLMGSTVIPTVTAVATWR